MRKRSWLIRLVVEKKKWFPTDTEGSGGSSASGIEKERRLFRLSALNCVIGGDRTAFSACHSIFRERGEGDRKETRLSNVVGIEQ